MIGCSQITDVRSYLTVFSLFLSLSLSFSLSFSLSLSLSRTLQYKQGIRHGYGVSRNEKGFWKNGTLAFGMTENLMERQLGDFEQNLTVIDDRKGLVFKGSFSRNGVSVGSLIVVGGETTFGKYVFAERLACQAPVEESLDAMTLVSPPCFSSL